MLKPCSSARAIVLAVLVACSTPACNSISSDQEQLLSTYLENAAQYYDGGHFQRAYQQWDQALAMDSGNQKARFGQAMALYQMGRIETTKAIEGPLTQATFRLDELRKENFDKDQWKVELGVAMVHGRWCEIYERKLRVMAEQETKGVPRDEKLVATVKSEFARHVAISEQAFKNVLEGSEKDPRDRLTCWLGLARISAWRDDLPASLEYANLYLGQVVRSKQLWKDSAERYPKEAPIYEAKQAGAALQEADLRDLMGAVLFRLGREDEAEVQVNKVLEMFPQRASAYLNRGILRQMRGDDDLARGDFKRFLNYVDLPDNDPSILEATRRLAEVESRLATQDAADRATPSPQ